jgi:hypothetical protein
MLLGRARGSSLPRFVFEPGVTGWSCQRRRGFVFVVFPVGGAAIRPYLYLGSSSSCAQPRASLASGFHCASTSSERATATYLPDGTVRANTVLILI